MPSTAVAKHRSLVHLVVKPKASIRTFYTPYHRGVTRVMVVQNVATKLWPVVRNITKTRFWAHGSGPDFPTLSPLRVWGDGFHCQ
eukprot:1683886-Amphidinium_carterae.1